MYPKLQGLSGSQCSFCPALCVVEVSAQHKAEAYCQATGVYQEAGRVLMVRNGRVMIRSVGCGYEHVGAAVRFGADLFPDHCGFQKTLVQVLALPGRCLLPATCRFGLGVGVRIRASV